MKKIITFLILGLVLISCKNTENRIGEFKLLPKPQKFEINGVSGLHSKNIKTYFSPQDIDLPTLGEELKGLKSVETELEADVIYKIDDTLENMPEGYMLSISEKLITITGSDKAGLFYGFKTLEQLLQDAKDQNVFLPLCEIVDYPLLAYRAIHLDIKHHINKTNYYYDLIDWLSSYKINAIIVELEDKIKYERQPTVAAADALSIEEWQNLSEYAYERNIEISPLVQGLGHAAFILKHDEYEHLRDDPESHWAFNPLNPETYKVQFDLYNDALKATPHGKYLHVGGDEVHTTGRNSGKSPMELQLIWLNKVSEFAEQHNRIPIFWDDMPLRHTGLHGATRDKSLTKEQVEDLWEENEHKLEEFLHLFPKNCIYMRWNYSSPEALGNIKAMQWFVENGFEVMGATAGQTRWVLMPQNQSNLDPIKSFAEVSIENGLDKLLLTLWDDDSPHFELYKRGITFFAEHSWAGNNRTKDELKSAYRHREFSHNCENKDYAFIDQLEEPVSFWDNILIDKPTDGRRLTRKHLVYEEFPNEIIIDLPNPDKPGWSEKYNDKLAKAYEAKLTCDSVADKISLLKQKANRNIYTLEVYEQVNNLVSFTSNALLSLKEYDTAQSDAEQKAALNKIKQLSKKFDTVRSEFEEVYSKTRNLNKPDDYILDQFHPHVHLASQTISFDWQFYAEMLFLENVNNWLKEQQ